MDVTSLLIARELRDKTWPGYDERTDGSPPHRRWQETDARRERVHFEPELEFLENLGKPADFLNMAEGKTHAQLLLEVQEKGYSLIQDDAGVSYAVALKPPYAAIEFKGKGALTRKLRHEVAKKHGVLVQDNALSQVIDLLQAIAEEQPRQAVHVRCAQRGDEIVVDIADDTGRAIVITPDGWKVAKRPPKWATFRRSRLTSELIVPAKSGGDLDLLRPFLNVDNDGWDLIRALLVMAWMSEIPVMAIAFKGPAGGTKTSALRKLVELIDPSPTPTPGPPKNEEAYLVGAQHRRLVGYDNISRIPPWFMDSLCRTVTGEGHLARQLYTNAELYAAFIRRVVVLTSVDPGALREDWASRIAQITLHKPREYKTETVLAKEWAAVAPRAMAGLCDVIVEVLNNDTEPLEALPRMADAGDIMTRMDDVLGSDSVGAFQRSQATLTADVLEGDPCASALSSFMTADPRIHRNGRSNSWVGTMEELLSYLPAHWPDDDGHMSQFPGNPRALAQRLNTMGNSLGEGWGLTFKQLAGRGQGRRRYKFTLDRGEG